MPIRELISRALPHGPVDSANEILTRFKSFRCAGILLACIEPIHTIKKRQLVVLKTKPQLQHPSSTRSPLIIGRSPSFSESHAATATEPLCAPTASAFALRVGAQMHD